MPKRTYESEALAAIHETAEGLRAAGAMSKTTMDRFDEMCLTPVRALSPGEIRDIRIGAGASQAVFARHLNVSVGLVSQWERGEKKPSGPALKLLTLVARRGLRSVA